MMAQIQARVEEEFHKLEAKVRLTQGTAESEAE
jgi:hypothetical protein